MFILQLKIKQDSLMRSALEDIANLMSSFFVGQVR